MTDATRKRLLTAAQVAQVVLPLLPGGKLVEVAATLVRGGMTVLQARQALADNNATPEQLQYLDEQNAISAIDKIRAQGKAI